MLRNSYRIISGIGLMCIISFFTLPVSGHPAQDVHEETSEVAVVSNQEGEMALLQDNFLRRILGERRGSRAERNTLSGEHNPRRPQNYRPPISASQPPSQQAQGGRMIQSRVTSVRNTPKPALHTSRREQQLSTGIWELGVSLATTHAITEVGNAKGLPASDFFNYHTSNISFGGGIYARYLMNDWFAMNMGMNFVNLAITAENPVTYQGLRVYSFNNDIYEFFGKTEFRLPGLAASPFDLYAYVGIGMFFSDVNIYNQDQRVLDAQDDYNQVQPFIPLGGGFSVKLTNNLKLGYEFGWRNTIFQYLDGVKEGDSYDHYFLNAIKIGFIF